MSARATGAVWKYSRHKGSELLVLLAIADFAKDDGRDSWPSVDTLATKTRLTERNVRYVLRKLEESGELICERNAGPRGANLYHINISADEGEKIAPAKIAPAKTSGGKSAHKGGANQRQGGAIAIAPKPSLRTVNEPSDDVAIATARTRARTTRIPDDWMPDEKLIEQAIGFGVAREQIAFETEKWRDYHAAKGDKVLDPAASWRTWMRNSVSFSAPRASPNGRAPVTFQEQIRKNNRAHSAAFLAAVEEFSGQQAVRHPDGPARRSLPDGGQSRDEGGVVDGTFREEW